MAKIRVTAGAGRLVPIPRAIYTEPGGELCYLGSKDDPEDAELQQQVGNESPRRAHRREIEVEGSHHFVQRSLRNGDLKLATPFQQAEKVIDSIAKAKE